MIEYMIYILTHISVLCRIVLYLMYFNNIQIPYISIIRVLLVYDRILHC